MERCQSCDRTRKHFACRNCVKEGNIYNHSKNDGVSFSCKEKRFRIVCAVSKEYQKRIASKLKETQQHHAKKSELILLKNRIETLKIIIKGTKQKNIAELLRNEELSDKLLEKREIYKSLPIRAEKLRADKFELQQKNIYKIQLEDKLCLKRTRLKNLQVSHVHALVKYIFPISKRKLYTEFGAYTPSDSPILELENSDVVSEVISAAELELEEATRIIHVDGRWVSDETDETEHTIVDVGMPASGDFIKYYEWLKSYRNEPRKHESSTGLHGNVVLKIPASLVYTTQLTVGLSYFLGLCLPNRVEYYDFSIFKVSRRRLYETVNRLSHNVMYLCFSQLVPFSELNPNELLKNLQLLVSATSLGWWGWFSTEEYRLPECMFDSDSSGEEINDSDCDDTIGAEQEDWDKLLDMPPNISEINSIPSLSSVEAASDNSSLSASASGLVSSAAASVISLWSWKR